MIPRLPLWLALGAATLAVAGAAPPTSVPVGPTVELEKVVVTPPPKPEHLNALRLDLTLHPKSQQLAKLLKQLEKV